MSLTLTHCWLLTPWEKQGEQMEVSQDLGCHFLWSHHFTSGWCAVCKAVAQTLSQVKLPVALSLVQELGWSTVAAAHNTSSQTQSRDALS